MAHAASRGRCLACNEPNYRFGAVFFDPACGFGFHATADFADYDDTFRFRIVHEQLYGFFGGGSDDGVSTDTDGGGDAQPRLNRLIYRFVRKRARLGHDPNGTLFEDETRHDADLRFVGRDDAGAIRADKPCVFVAQVRFYLNHIFCGDTFRNTNDDGDTGCRSFHNGIGGECRGYENDRYIGAGSFHGVCNRVEYRSFEMGLTAFARGDPTDHIRAVFNHLRSMVRAFVARETLYDYFRILIY